MEVAFIYNELNKEGNFKAVYYNSIDASHKSELKFTYNQNRKLIEISPEQQEEIQSIVNRFIAGSTRYSDNGNEEIDHSLLVSSDTGGRRVNYYYWRNDVGIPKGVEQLLQYLDKSSK